jgi:hypothetical protein
MSDRPKQEETGRAPASAGDAFLASKRRVAERNEQASKAATQRRRAFDELRAKLRSESEGR